LDRLEKKFENVRNESANKFTSGEQSFASNQLDQNAASNKKSAKNRQNNG